MEDNYYASVDNKKMYINYFDALYLLNIVFKKNKEYEFIDKSHIESIWNSIDYKYHKFCVIKGFEYELGGYEVQIGDEYKGVCEKLFLKIIQILLIILSHSMKIQILKNHTGKEEIMLSILLLREMNF